MRTEYKRYALMVALVFVTLVTTAAGPDGLRTRGAPQDMHLRLTVRDDPALANSPARWIFRLHLQAVRTAGRQVGWELSDLWVSEIAGDGSVLTWHDSEPPTTLWWVSHDNAGAPAVADFHSVPQWDGVAAAVGHKESDLEYSLASRPLARPPTVSAVSWTALDFRLQAPAAQDPKDEGEDTPTEVDDDKPEIIDDPDDPPGDW